MRLPRMTTRRRMIAVAVIATVMELSILGYRLGQSRAHRLSLARSHAELETRRRRGQRGSDDAIRAFDQELVLDKRRIELREENREAVSILRQNASILRKVLKSMRERSPHVSQVVECHAAMAEKYRRAARYPWLPVESDPPNPE